MVFVSGGTPWNNGKSKYDRPGLPVSWKKAKRLFGGKKLDARTRGIPFQMTYDEWLSVWLKSGHLYEAGCYTGQYVMARFGDKGPYKVGNVKIVTCNENNSEKTISKAGRARISASRIGKPTTLGRKHSKKTRAKLSEAARRRPPRKHSEEAKQKIALGNTGKKFSKARRRKIALAARRRWQNEATRLEQSELMKRYYKEKQSG